MEVIKNIKKEDIVYLDESGIEDNACRLNGWSTIGDRCYDKRKFRHIAEMFWIKNKLSLTPKELIEIAFWSNLAWTFKVLFSYLVDSTKFLKGDKRYYIILSNLSLALGYLILILTVYDIKIFSIYNQLLISGI